MATIRLENITKRFGKITALRNMSFEVKDGEFFCVLGPPGAGKTTTLRTIIGLEKPDEGIVYIDGQEVNDIHPSRRDISMIFQNLALYPDKTVFDNIASPLWRLSLSEEEIRTKVTEVASQLRIDWLLEKTPSQLSGGERQRVAIGRAIVRKPKAYLMDEPLSNLDALLRLEMRVSLKELQTDLKETFVYVTHDQVEALSMADRVLVLNRGVIQQIGTPGEVYRLPHNTFVAQVLGNPSMNFINCNLKEGKDKIAVVHEGFSLYGDAKALKEAFGVQGGKGWNTQSGDVMLGIRPEDITILFDKPKTGCLEAEVYVTEPLGNKTIVDIKIGKDVIKAIAQASFSGGPGKKVWLTLKESKLHLFDRNTGACMYHSANKSPLHAT